jgi:hydroxypyruvate reductase
MAAATTKPDVLTVAKLPPFLMEPLHAAFTVHDRLHESDPAAFAAAAPRIRAVVGGGESKVPKTLMAQLPALEIVSIMGVGYDGVDVAAAIERKVPVTHTPGVLNDDVADLAIGLMLSVSRRIPQADQYVRAGKWLQGPMPLARKMSGARLGIVGLGRIGQAIATRAQAFGMSIAYTARSQKSELAAYRYFSSAKALAAEVDFLVAITPGGAGTRKLINAEVLQALGPQGYLINVARGSVVDQAALVHALQNGVIAGAGLDVFEEEPKVPVELFTLDNVVLTPHMASATTQTRHAMANLAVSNLVAHFAGKPLLSPVPECQA